MDINITAIERLIRLFTQPVALTIFPLIGYAFLPAPGNSSPVLAGIAQVFHSIGGVLLLASLIGVAWGAKRCWMLWKWESGDLDGGCYNCAGPMQHKDGRYGPYSVCIMCGSKREGHH